MDANRLRELEQQLQFNEKLRAVTNRINSANNVTEILVQLQPDILGLFDSDRLTIYAVDPAKKQLVSRHMAGSEIKEIRVPISPASIAGFAAYSGRLINIADVYNDADLMRIDSKLGFDKSWDQKSGYRSKQMLVVPIIFEKKLLGVLQLINKKHGTAFTKFDEKNAVEITRILGIAFRNQSKMARTRFDALVANGLIAEGELKNAIAQARDQNKDPETVLMESFKIKKSDIGASLGDYYGCQFVEFSHSVLIDKKLLQGLNVGFLKRAFWLPMSLDDGKLTVLIDNPRDPKVMEIKNLMRARDYEYRVALKEDILKFFEYIEKDTGFGATASGAPVSISDILAEMDVKEVKGEESDASDGSVDENASTIVRLVNQIIIDGCERGASDIHVEPSKARNKTYVRFRIDGSCVKNLEIPYSYSRALASRLKIMSNLDISERRLPQDGKIKFMYKDRQVELRVATVPTVGGEDVVMRILAASEPMPIDALNLSKRNETELLRIMEKPYGIVLVVGPTGSGKTTTLHAAVGHINTPERKIWTAEDPVEITQEGLRQVEVKPKIDFNFARAMRAFLRADPDVIMVGEMRDNETASIGIEASLTGHLVLSTLHTNSAPETVTRLIDMGLDPFNFADALLGILAQRLVRTLCPKCKEAYTPAQEEFDDLAASYGPGFEGLGVTLAPELKLYRHKGCSACNNTGYKGRTGLHELLIGTDTVKAIIARKAHMEDIRSQAIADGMTTLYQDGIAKVFKGQTDIKMVRTVCIK